MDGTTEDAWAAGMAASDAGRFAESYRLLLPFAEAGDVEAQGAVGSFMHLGLHRVESIEQLNAGTGPVIDEVTASADREAAAKFLIAASEAGLASASFNLADLYLSGYGGGTWEDRKARAAKMYGLAYTQGLTVFGWLMNGEEGPGQPYLNAIERYELEGDQCPPPEWWRAATEPCSNPATK